MSGASLRAVVAIVSLAVAGPAPGAAESAPGHDYPMVGMVVRCDKTVGGWDPGALPNLHQAVSAWAEPRGLEAAYWRGLLVAEPARRETVWERISQGVVEPYRSLLLRPWDEGRDGSVEGHALVTEAMKALYQDAARAAGRPVLAQAACWMAAPELMVLVQPLVDAARGTATWRAVPRSDFAAALPPWERERDPCQEHLLVSSPSPGEGADLSRTFHGPGYDVAARWLQERKGVIPVAEFRRRVLSASPLQQDALLAQEAGWQKPVSLEAAGTAAAVLAQVAAAAGVPLAAAGTPGPVVQVRVREGRAGDVARAIARVARLSLARAEGGGYRLEPAEGVREALTTALPLPLWAGASTTPVESQVFCAEAIQDVWAAVRAERAVSAPGGRELMPTPQASTALLWAMALDAGERLRPWLRNLPDRAGRVPLALYESDQHNFMELAAPTVSEVVQGARYLVLKAEWDGRGAVVRKVRATGKEGQG